jgi:hypothetical protein
MCSSPSSLTAPLASRGRCTVIWSCLASRSLLSFLVVVSLACAQPAGTHESDTTRLGIDTVGVVIEEFFDALKRRREELPVVVRGLGHRVSRLR